MRIVSWIALATFGISSTASAAISYVGSGTVAAADNADVTPTLSSGHAANDVNLVLVGIESASATAAIAGYTQIFLQSTSVSKLYLFCKLDNGSESDPLVDLSNGVSDNSIIARTYTLRGALTDCANLVAHSAGQTNPAVDLSVEYPALAVTTPNTFVAILYAHGENNVSGDSTPVGFMDTGYAYTGLGSDQAINLKYQVQTTATSVSAGAITITGSQTAPSLSIVLALKPAAAAPPPPDITVCDSGCNQLNTTAGISAAIAAAAAGDIIEFRTTPAGSSEIWAAQVKFIGKSASAGNPIIVRVRDGDHVTLQPLITANDTPTSPFSDSCLVAAVCFDNAHYIRLEGDLSSRTGLLINNPAEWSATTYESGPTNSYDARHALEIGNASSYIGLKNLTVAGARAYEASEVARDAHHVRFENVAISGPHGTDKRYCSGVPCNPQTDWGNLFVLQAQRVLFKNSLAKHGGHDSLDVKSPWFIAQDSEFDGYWDDLVTGVSGAGSKHGTRAFILGGADNEKWKPSNVLTSTFGPQLVERSWIHRGLTGGDQENAQTCFKLHNIGGIVRGNVITECNGHAIQLPGFEAINTLAKAWGNQHIYHNTIYDTYTIIRNEESETPAGCSSGNGERNATKNNLFQNVHTGLQNPEAIHYSSNICSLGSYDDAWRDWTFTANIFAGDAAAMKFQCTGPGCAIVDVTDSTHWPTEIFGNSNATITFANAANALTDPWHALALSPSNTLGLGDATPLTTVTDSGTNTSLTLLDPYYFHDGWGLDFSKIGFDDVQGDWIAVTPTSGGVLSTAVCTRITSVNYSTGVTNVSPAVTHVTGSNVWWGGDGFTCVLQDNRGAIQ